VGINRTVNHHAFKVVVYTIVAADAGADVFNPVFPYFVGPLAVCQQAAAQENEVGLAALHQLVGKAGLFSIPPLITGILIHFFYFSGQGKPAIPPGMKPVLYS
jgi:hypothetical protein